MATTTSLEPTLTIASPEEGSTILGTNITVDFTVGGLVLTDFERVQTPKTGMGHLHFWLDSPVAKPERAIENFRNESFTFTRVPEGNHTLVVEVVNNDHSSFRPPVAQIVSFKTVLPKDVTLNALTSPSPIPPLPITQRFSEFALPLFVALILINLGVLFWIISRRSQV